MYAPNHFEVSSNAVMLDILTADHAGNVLILCSESTGLSVEMK